MTDTFHARASKIFQYGCPKHGDQGNFSGVSIEIVEDQNTSEGLRPYAGKRNYCFACYIDMLDANLCRLVETEK